MSERVPNNQKSFVMSEIVSRIRTIEKNEPKHILTISSTQGWVDQRERWSREMAGESLRKYTKLKNGDFSYNKGNSKTFPYGCIFRLDKWEEAVVPNVYHSFAISHDQVNSDYLQQYFWSGGLDKQLRKVLTSSVRDNGLLNITADTFFSLKVSLPPLPEQKKIASILTSVDEVIEITQKQIDKLQDLKKATMNELLTKGIGHTEFKDSELGRIPKSWEVLTVSDYVDVGRGYAFKTADFSNSGNPIIRVTNISAGNRLDLSKNVFYLDCDRSEEFKKFRLNDEDFLLVMVGATVGKYALVETFGKEVFLNQNMWRLRVRDQKRHEQKYAGYALQMVVDRFLKTSQGSARDFLTQKEFGSALVATPKLGEQKKVQEILDIIVAQQRNLSIKLSQTQSLKKSLMQDLLTGKVRVQVN